MPRSVPLSAEEDATLTAIAQRRHQTPDAVLHAEVQRTLERLEQHTLAEYVDIVRQYLVSLTPAERTTFMAELAARPRA